MEFLNNGITLDIPPGAFPISTDSMALAHFVRLPKNARALDLGSGCGTLGLLLCADDPGCHVTGIELDVPAHEAALENIRRNGLEARMESICGDLREVSSKMPAGQFSAVLSNPPYFSGGAESRSFPAARQESRCTLAELIAAAARAVKFGGSVFLVHKPERLAEIIALGASHGLEAKRLLLLRHRTDGPINLIFIQLRKGGRPGLVLEEAALFDQNGTPTDYYKTVYHLA